MPIGFIWHWEIGLGFDPDLRVQKSIRAIFARFRQCGSARQVLLSIAAEQMHFPPELAAPIAVRTVLDNATPKPREVIFCCFSDDDLETYRKVLHRHREERP